jgi:hypothetical protein
VPRGLTCGDEVKLVAPAYVQTCIGVASFCIGSGSRLLHPGLHRIPWSLMSASPFAVLFSNTPFFHLPDCTIAVGVRDFIMAEYDTSWHQDGLDSI